MRNNYKDKFWMNQRFGRLVILSIDNNGKDRTYWICKCDCGNTVSRSAQTIVSGHVKSCGCLFNERRHRLVCDKSGQKSRLYTVWVSMRSRCNNPNASSYENYGGRGISVCKEWDSYPSFRKWAIQNGYDPTAPRGMCTLDRINVNGNYSPENCRWVDSVTQARNKRPVTRPNTHRVSDKDLLKLIDMAQMKLAGKSYEMIGRKYGISRQAVHQKLSKNIPQ